MQMAPWIKLGGGAALLGGNLCMSLRGFARWMIFLKSKFSSVSVIALGFPLRVQSFHVHGRVLIF
jgi:hypothetical protein